MQLIKSLYIGNRSTNYYKHRRNIGMNSVLVLFVGLAATVHGFVSKPNCPSGWKEFGNNCYLFDDTQFTFTEAEIFCLQHNSHLVDINSRAENEFLKKEMFVQKTGHQDTFWLGIVDEGYEGDWRYSHMGTKMNFTDWYPGQPHGATSENCMVAPHYFDFHWGDYNCDDKCCFAICKKHFDDILQVVGK